MKRQEELVKMRKNREAIHIVELRRQSERQRLEHEKRMAEYAEQDRLFNEQMARHDEFSMMAMVLTQAACIPLMSPEYYAGIQDRMTRLANEHGVHADKPSRKFKVIGGQP